MSTASLISKATGIYEYSGLLRSSGPCAERIGALSICLVTFVGCLGYFVLIPQFLQTAFLELCGIQYEEYIFILALPLVIYPLCLLRDLKPLRFSSTVGMISVLYCLGLLVYEAIADYKTLNNPIAEFKKWESSAGIFIVINVVAIANCCHFTLPPIYGALRDRSIQRMKIVIIVAYAVVFVIYVVFGICGYYIFRSDSEGNILDNFNGEDGAAVRVVVARLSMAVSLIGSFPLCFKAGMNALEYQFFSEPETRWNFEENPRFRMMVIIVILTVLTLISLPLDDIGPLASVHGAVAVLLLICAFPIVIYWNIRFGRGSTLDGGGALQQLEMTSYRKMHEQEIVSHGIPTRMHLDSSRKDGVKKIGLSVLFVCGSALGIAGIVETILILAGQPPLLFYL